MRPRHHWQVWRESDPHKGERFRLVNRESGSRDQTPTKKILCEGSHATCLSYYKKHGGSKAGLHLGFDI